MIKPTYLWALCKTCEDSRWIGDICRYLGGQDVSLDFGQKQVADMVKMDSDWMDERINWNREAARMRQARARERRNAERTAQEKTSREVTDVTRDRRDNGGVTRSHAAVTPSIHPSIRPDINLKQDNIQGGEEGGAAASPPSQSFSDSDDLVEAEAAKIRRPEKKTVMDAAMIAGIKPDVAERWLEYMRRMDWHFSNGSRVIDRNFRTSLTRFAARERGGVAADAGDGRSERVQSAIREACTREREMLRREGLA